VYADVTTQDDATSEEGADVVQRARERVAIGLPDGSRAQVTGVK